MNLYHLIKLNDLLKKIKENNDFHWSVTDDSLIVTDANNVVYVFSMKRSENGKT